MQFLLQASEFGEMCKLDNAGNLFSQCGEGLTQLAEVAVSAVTSPETSSFSYLDHHSWSSQALVWFAVRRSLVLFFFMVGACWSSLWSPESSQLLLGG